MDFATNQYSYYGSPGPLATEAIWVCLIGHSHPVGAKLRASRLSPYEETVCALASLRPVELCLRLPSFTIALRTGACFAQRAMLLGRRPSNDSGWLLMITDCVLKRAAYPGYTVIV